MERKLSREAKGKYTSYDDPINIEELERPRPQTFSKCSYTKFVRGESIFEKLKAQRLDEENMTDAEKVCKWNTLFQRTLEMDESTPLNVFDKYFQLSQLSNRFVHQAKIIGRTILAEYRLPSSQQTIKTSALPGLAGNPLSSRLNTW